MVKGSVGNERCIIFFARVDILRSKLLRALIFLIYTDGDFFLLLLIAHFFSAFMDIFSPISATYSLY